jgi:peptide/nickel transport system permease protein
MLLVSFPLGIVSALNQNKPADYAVRFFNTLVIAIPTFCIGILLMMVFAVSLGWLPVLPGGDFRQIILPSLTIGIGSGASLARLLRSQIITAMQKEHVRAALTFGVSRHRVIVNNVLKNAMPPVITNIGLFAGALLGGSAIIETLFSWPGAGRYAVGAIFGRDYPVIQAYALIMAAIYIMINLLTDIINCAFAPSADILGVSKDA